MDLFLSQYHQCIILYYIFSGSRSSKTFKPKKNIPEGTHQYELMKHAAATLGSGNLRLAVMLPEGEDLNEWVAVNSKSAKHIFFDMYGYIYINSYTIVLTNKVNVAKLLTFGSSLEFI